MLKNVRWLIIPAFVLTMVGSYAVSATVKAKSPTAAAPASSSPAGSAYNALPPTRLLDTRTNSETLGPNSSLNLTVTGGSVPSDATAVVLNVTVTGTSSASDLTVYPTGEARPASSNLNWVAGETVPNLVIVPVGTNGQVTFYNVQGQTNVVVDLEGYFAPGATGAQGPQGIQGVPGKTGPAGPAFSAASFVLATGSSGACAYGAIGNSCGVEATCPTAEPYVVSGGYVLLSSDSEAYSVAASEPIYNPPADSVLGSWDVYGVESEASPSAGWTLYAEAICSS